jgi:pimeloyl-ACP methyl ester carboxylesterase
LRFQRGAADASARRTATAAATRSRVLHRRFGSAAAALDGRICRDARADDGLAVADALGWDGFAVLGVSGGGPHALALGTRAPERVRALGLAVGGAPGDVVDPEDLIAINREGLRARGGA